VWERVHNQIRERGFQQLPNSELNRAFMRNNTSTNLSPKSKTPQTQRRLLPAKAAFTADVLHSHLVRCGFTNASGLAWAVGSAPPTPVASTPATSARRSRRSQRAPMEGSGDEEEEGDEEGKGTPSSSSRTERFSIASSSDSSNSSDTESESTSDSESEGDLVSSSNEGGVDSQLPEPAIQEKVLDVLVELLRTVEGAEDNLIEEAQARKEGRMIPVSSQDELAPTDEFFVQLLLVASPEVVRWRTETMHQIIRFPLEVDSLQTQLGSCIGASKVIVASTSLPILLEGVLTMGNYVNASSTRLGKALAVTLDSLVNLTHTKCMPTTPPSKGGARVGNALGLLVQQLQETHGPAFRAALAEDLRRCKEAKDCEPKALEEGVERLRAQVAAIEDRLPGLPSSSASGEPRALRSKQMQQFVDESKPKVVQLEVLVKELDEATSQLRKFFAEPKASTLSQMLKALASLFDALPPPPPPAVEPSSEGSSPAPLQPPPPPPLGRRRSSSDGATPDSGGEQDLPKRPLGDRLPALRRPAVPPLPLGKPKVPPLQLGRAFPAIASSSASSQMPPSCALPPSSPPPPPPIAGVEAAAAAAAAAAKQSPSGPAIATADTTQLLWQPVASTCPSQCSAAVATTGVTTPTPRQVLAGRRGTPATPRDVNCGELSSRVSAQASTEPLPAALGPLVPLLPGGEAAGLGEQSEVAPTGVHSYWSGPSEYIQGLESWEGPAVLSTPIKEEPSESGSDHGSARSSAPSTVSTASAAIVTAPRSVAQSFYAPRRPSNAAGAGASASAFSEWGQSYSSGSSSALAPAFVEEPSLSMQPTSMAQFPSSSMASVCTAPPMAKLPLADLHSKQIAGQFGDGASTSNRSNITMASTTARTDSAATGSSPPTAREPGLTRIFGFLMKTPRSSATTPRTWA